MNESVVNRSSRQLKKLLEMIRFSHTVFALPFALLAAAMAWTAPANEPVHFNWIHLLGILIAMVGARSAAMAFNRLVDRKIDGGNQRTKNRHLPSGQLTIRAVVTFIILSVVVYLAGTLFFLPNYLPLAVSLPVLLVLFGYSYTKRFTSLAHFWLGLALALAPVCTWIAIRGGEVMANPTDVAAAVVLGLAVMFWVSGFDIIYACQDYEFDRTAGLKSVPVLLGIPGALRMAALCHAVMVALLVLLPLLSNWFGPSLGLGWIYAVTVSAIVGLLIYEHAIVRPDDLAKVNVAFFNVNAIVSFGLFLFATFDLLFFK